MRGQVNRHHLVDAACVVVDAPSDRLLPSQAVLLLNLRCRRFKRGTNHLIRCVVACRIGSSPRLGLRIEDLPAPPSNGLRPATKGWLSETILLQLALASRLEPFAFAEERKGALIQEVVPTRTAEISSLGGSLPLSWHSDKGYLKAFRSEYLCLIGLLNDSTPTLLADVTEALGVLRGQDSSLIKIL